MRQKIRLEIPRSVAPRDEPPSFVPPFRQDWRPRRNRSPDAIATRSSQATTRSYSAQRRGCIKNILLSSGMNKMLRAEKRRLIMLDGCAAADACSPRGTSRRGRLYAYYLEYAQHSSDPLTRWTAARRIPVDEEAPMSPAHHQTPD